MCSWWWSGTALLRGSSLFLWHTFQLNSWVSHGVIPGFRAGRGIPPGESSREGAGCQSPQQTAVSECDRKPWDKISADAARVPHFDTSPGKNGMCKQGAMNCTWMWGSQCLCVGWEDQVCGWLSVCSPECVTSSNDEWHCWLCIAIASTGENWEMLGCGGGIPEGKPTLICLNLRDNAFPSFEIQYISC